MFYFTRSATPDYAPQYQLVDPESNTIAIYNSLHYVELAVAFLNQMLEEEQCENV